MPTPTPSNLPKTSRDLPGQKPKVDKKRDRDEAIVKDKAVAKGWDTDAVHGEGRGIGIRPKQ